MALHRQGDQTQESRQHAEHLAIQALAFLAADQGRLDRFLMISGIAPQQLRRAAAEPEFLAGVLDHLGTEEALLLAFAAHAGIDPSAVARARRALPGASWGDPLP
jgi:Protein of unknown function (DUF3572)